MICTRQRFAYVSFSLRNVFRVSPRFNWLRLTFVNKSNLVLPLLNVWRMSQTTTQSIKTWTDTEYVPQRKRYISESLSSANHCFLPTMYIYCDYAALTKFSKQLSNLTERLSNKRGLNRFQCYTVAASCRSLYLHLKK
jgi:hypothetical protein